MSKNLFKIFLVLGVIVSMSLITGLSCNKAGDNGGNNSGGSSSGGSGSGSGSGDSSGGGNSGGGSSAITPAKITFLTPDATIASMEEVNGETHIKLKASGFPTTEIINSMIVDVSVAITRPSSTYKKAFDVVITGGVVGTAAATGGLVLVGPGDLAATDFSVKGPGYDINTYTSDEKTEGILSYNAKGSVTANQGIIQVGWNILSPFISRKAVDQNNLAPNVSPFAFTPITTGANSTMPVMICVTTISSITSGAAAGTGTAQDDTTLTGGQKASCYVGGLEHAFAGAVGTNWLTESAKTNSLIKKEFYIAAMGIRTDNDPISSLGLTGNSADFRDGINTTEMALIKATKKDSNSYKKVLVKIVN